MTLLAKRYAQALFTLAVEQNAVDAVAADLASLHAQFAAPAARTMLTSPDVSSKERGAVLDKVAASASPLVRNVLGVLQHRRRLSVLLDIHPAFRTLVMASRGEVEGTVESAHPLADDEIAALTTLAGRLSGKKVHLSVVTKPDLLGGVRLRIGNLLYDGSLRSALDQLEQKLQQSSV